MHKLVTLAAVVILAASSANCARDNSSEESSATVTGPSATEARGGGGGKGGGGSTGDGSSSVKLRIVTDSNANGLPNWGDRVTFDISTTATTQPHVDLTCYQNGTVVLGATAGFYEGYPWPWTQVMTLSSPSWRSDGANCTAILYYFSGSRNTVIASTSFTAYP